MAGWRPGCKEAGEGELFKLTPLQGKASTGWQHNVCNRNSWHNLEGLAESRSEIADLTWTNGNAFSYTRVEDFVGRGTSIGI